jgi:hypothetical protein
VEVKRSAKQITEQWIRNTAIELTAACPIPFRGLSWEGMGAGKADTNKKGQQRFK